MPAPRRVLIAAAIIALLLACATFVFLRRGSNATAPRPALTVLEALGPGANDDRFARADKPRAFHFPEDHGPHPEFRNEWWYWTGNLVSDKGRAFGYELTIFRTSMAPDQDTSRASAWAPRDIFLAHFTISDLTGKRFYAFERTSRGALGLAGAEGSPLRVWVLDWSAAASGSAGAPPLRLRANDGEFSLDLELEQGKPTVLEGDNGWSRKGPDPGNASYYYSLTRMPTAGALTVAGQTVRVHGESWMDREWSTRALHADQVGWDWFALRFDDGRELMFFHLRRRDGQRDAFSSGTLVDKDGTARHLGAEDVALEPWGVWTSPHSHIAYPATFRLAVPSAGLEVHVEPLLADQELALTFRYWEGAVRATGKGPSGPISGTGYLELTGYGEGTRQTQ